VRRDVERRGPLLAESGIAPESVDMLISGTVIGGLAESFSTDLVDIFAGDVAVNDVIAGPTAVDIRITWADALLSSEA
jgi:hypothetical protein